GKDRLVHIEVMCQLFFLVAAHAEDPAIWCVRGAIEIERAPGVTTVIQVAIAASEMLGGGVVLVGVTVLPLAVPDLDIAIVICVGHDPIVPELVPERSGLPGPVA